MSNIVQIALFTVVKGRLPGSEQPREGMILIRCVFLFFKYLHFKQDFQVARYHRIKTKIKLQDISE